MFIKAVDFCQKSALRIGGVHEVCFIESSDNPKDFVDFFIVGGANNLLISPESKKLASLSKDFDFIKDCGDFLEIGARTSSGRIYNYFLKNDLFGLEFLRALPGYMGGLVKMNAGMKEFEMSEVVDSACIQGEWSSNLELSYRNSNIKGLITSIKVKKIKGFRHNLVKVFEKMRESHPHEPSCGSCFKNPPNDYAGRLIQAVGLKGYEIGGAAFSQKHANFLVNLNNATFQNAIDLINLAKTRVLNEFGINLECEVKIV